MMNRQRVEVVLLCEDSRHETFIRSYLKKISSIKTRNIETLPLSDGYGSAEQKVRENFRNQVEVYKNRSAKMKGGLLLIVMIDADKSSVKERIDQLENSLTDQRKQHDKIVILVPRRNIETWVEYAHSGNVDESTDYKRLNQHTSYYKEAAHRFAEQICPAGLPENAPPSLFTACEELNRIL